MRTRPGYENGRILPGSTQARRWIGPLLAGLVGALLAAAGARDAAAYEQRPGTISLGLQGGGGYAWGEGSYVRTADISGTTHRTEYPYDKYTGGGGLGIRIRYSLDPTHAVGLSLEDLRFARLSGQAEQVSQGGTDTIYADQFQTNNYMVDYYLYYGLGAKIGRRFKHSPYAVLSAGIHRDTFRISRFEAANPAMGFVGAFGLGWEYFVRRPFAVDLSARGYYFKLDGGSAVAAEAMLGFQYYILR